MDLLAAMRTFVRVVEMGSLSKAAGALRLSVPAVSRQVAQLEAELGTSLLLRTTRRLSLTDPGQRFLEGARRTLRDVDDVVVSTRGGGEAGITGALTVSAPVVLGICLVEGALPTFLAAHPKLCIDLRMEDRVVDLLADGVDIALRAGIDPPDSSALVARHVGRFEKVLCASPDYLRAHGAPRAPEDLARHDAIALLSDAAGAGVVRFEAARARPVMLRGRLRVGSPLGVRAAAIAGLGVAVLPRWLAADALSSGSLRALLPRHRLAPDVLVAIHRAEVKASPPIRAFLAFLEEHPIVPS